MWLDRVGGFGHADVTTELGAQRRHPCIADTAGHDLVEVAELHVAVQREPVHGHPTRHPDPEGRDLELGPPSVRCDPDPGTPSYPAGWDAEVRAGTDQRFLEAADVVDDEHVVRQGEDGVSDELTRTVEGDLAAAIDFDHWCGVGWAFVRLSPPPGGVNGRVLEQQHRVIDRPRIPRGVQTALLGQRHGVLDAISPQPPAPNCHRRFHSLRVRRSQVARLPVDDAAAVAEMADAVGMKPWRYLVLTTVCTIALSACSSAAPVEDAAPAAATFGTSVAPTSPAPTSRWARVLTGLDRRRALAYASAEPKSLRNVYARASTALTADRRMLRAYSERGITLTGVRLDLLAVRLVGRGSHWVRLRVIDQLRRPVAHAAGATMLLPQDQPTRWLIGLRRNAGGWRIANVHRLAG